MQQIYIDIFKNRSSVLKLLNKISVGRYQGHNFGFDVLNNTFWQINAENFYRDNIFGALSKLFIANLDTKSFKVSVLSQSATIVNKIKDIDPHA